MGSKIRAAQARARKRKDMGTHDKREEAFADTECLGEVLSELVAHPGWEIVLQYVEGRRKQAFDAWGEGERDGLREQWARSNELEALVKWVSNQIDAGKLAGQHLVKLEQSRSKQDG